MTPISPPPIIPWRSQSTQSQPTQPTEAGPSDYWRRSHVQDSPPSSPSSSPSLTQITPSRAWRTASHLQPDSQSPGIDHGPSDEYFGSGHRPAFMNGEVTDDEDHSQHPTRVEASGSPVTNGDQADERRYEQRQQRAVDGRDPIIRRSPPHDFDDEEASSSPAITLENGYKQTYDDIMGDARPTSLASADVDEEFGALKASLSNGRDEQTTTTGSAISKRLGDRPYPNRITLMNPEKRASFVHPSISRLRSHMRTSSNSTQQSARQPLLAHMRTSSHFSQISEAKSETVSLGDLSLPSTITNPLATAHQSDHLRDDGPAFVFNPLRRLSAHLFSRLSNGGSPAVRPPASRKVSTVLGIARSNDKDESPEEELGRPTAMDIRGMIAVGTSQGFVIVYGFGQEVKHILSNEASASPVTTLTISPDQTYIAVGRASGNIHLYDLSNPSKPARTALALTLKQVSSGRREGHLQGSRISHIGFVGARHTSIVTGDEHGRAFWWSLGKVIGVESNDVVRMLGSYPETETEATTYPSKKPTTLFAVSPLPLGQEPRPIDSFSLSVLLTPTKLVVVGMKPSPKTWFRRMRNGAGGDLGGLSGCATWLEVNRGSDRPAPFTTLAYSWGTTLRLLRITTENNGKDIAPIFAQQQEWEAPDVIRAILAYNEDYLLVITSTSLALIEISSMRVVESTTLQTRLLSALDLYSGLSMSDDAPRPPDSLAGSIKLHRHKLFLLTNNTLQVGSLQHWNDRILSRVQQGDFLSAIQVALAYYENRAKGNLINLPQDLEQRRGVIHTRLKELMLASLQWAFSPNRLTDDTHYSPDGRGVDLTGLFEGLAATCIEACLSIGDRSFLFDEVYEHFAQTGIQGIFIKFLEPHILSGRLKEVPPTITQSLITTHEERGELDQAESVIWNVDPISLDINQAIHLCEAHGLWDAMIHVYTRAMNDYIAPLVKLITVVRDIQNHRSNRPSLVGDQHTSDAEEMAPNAYKLYAYIEATLSGLSYPSGEPLPEAEGHVARTEVYTFIFQGRTITWPVDGELVLTGEGAEPPYPYLSLLLRFDTEAFLHSMDIAFEDPYLNDAAGAINRQSIVNLMLDVMDPEYFHPGDITFLHIFVARNLPKYPQFLFIPPSTLHRILVSLASDPDQSTREDRQLAAEYLLSAYTPHDLETMLNLFDQAGFFRILRQAYRREERWAQLISTLLKDPESDDEVFSSLDEIIRAAPHSTEVKTSVIEALPHLYTLGVRPTALFIDRDLPECHDQAIELLDSAPHKQMAYLRCLLEPDTEEGGMHSQSVHISLNARHRYVALLCDNDFEHVITYLDSHRPEDFDLVRLADDSASKGYHEPQMWALDRQGRSKEAMDVAGSVLRLEGSHLGDALVANEIGAIHLSLQIIQSVTRTAVRLCREHSMTRRDDHQIEDMWLDILHEIIELVHAASALRGQTTNTTGANPAEDLVVSTMRSLVQETLASLLSSSSTSLSFPRLFKRLVDASTSTTKVAKKGRAYSEFRIILTGMLDSYRAEGEMLGMTTKLVEADLYEILVGLKEKRNQGWRPSTSNCHICTGPLFIDHGCAEGLIVEGSGRLLHRRCLETQL